MWFWLPIKESKQIVRLTAPIQIGRGCRADVFTSSARSSTQASRRAELRRPVGDKRRQQPQHQISCGHKNNTTHILRTYAHVCSLHYRTNLSVEFGAQINTAVPPAVASLWPFICPVGVCERRAWVCECCCGATIRWQSALRRFSQRKFYKNNILGCWLQ